MKKKSTRKFNWSASVAFGDGRYSGAAKANNKKSPGKKKNNDAGVIGRAGLVEKEVRRKIKEQKK